MPKPKGAKGGRGGDGGLAKKSEEGGAGGEGADRSDSSRFHNAALSTSSSGAALSEGLNRLCGRSDHSCSTFCDCLSRSLAYELS